MVTKVKDGIQYPSLTNIKPNPYQANRREDASLQELAESILAHGMLETPVGRPAGGLEIELGSGHRRLAAHKLLVDKGHLEHDTMRVRVLELTDEQMADIVIQENKKRQDLDAIAEARFYKRYMEDFKVSQVQLAERVGFSQAEISNTMRLLELPAVVQDMIITREITGRHGRELLRIKALPELCEKIAEKAVKDGSSVNQINRHIASEVSYSYKSVDKDSHGVDRPLFDTGPCRKCESRVEYITQYDSSKRSICANPDCWKKKQAEADAKSKVERQAEVDAMVADLQAKAPAPSPAEVGKKKKPPLGKLATDPASAKVTKALDLDKLNYNEYERLEDYTLRQMDKPEECETCVNRVVAAHKSYAHDKPSYVCLKPSCVRDKKTSKTRQTNKAVKADVVQRRAVIDDALAQLRTGGFKFMEDRDFLLAIMEAVIDGRSEGRYDSAVSKDYQLEPHDRSSMYPDVRLDQWLAEKSTEEVAWMLVRETILRKNIREQTIQAARLCVKIGQESPTMKCRKCGEERNLDRGLHLSRTSYGAIGQESFEGECQECIEKGYRKARGEDLEEDCVTNAALDAEAQTETNQAEQETEPAEDESEQPQDETNQAEDEPADEKLRTFRIDKNVPGRANGEYWGDDIKALTPKEALDITGWKLADVNIRELTPVVKDETTDSGTRGGGWRKVKAEEVEGLVKV